MRALFFGTPAFAVPCLEALRSIADVVGVVCQPDRPAGRGNVPTAPPVKLYACQHGLAVVQPTKLRTGEFAAWVRSQDVQVALVVAYGRILPRDVLDATKLGYVNVHASLLPKYRGAAPLAWAVFNGETETGITLMVLDEGMDTGPMFAKYPTAIDPSETAGELGERLALLGASAVRQELPRYVRGETTLEPQDPLQGSFAPMLTKEHGRVDWTKPASAVHNQVRAMEPWPGAYALLGNKTCKVRRSRVVTESAQAGKPGEVVVADKTRLVVACAGGAVELVTVQLEGKKTMRGVDWVMGRGVRTGDVLQ